MSLTTEEIETLRDNTVAALNTAVTNPKPTYKVGGRSFNWNGWLEHLRNLLKDLNEMLSNLPCEEHTIYEDPTL